MKKNIDKYLMIIATVFWAGAFIAGKFSIAQFPIFSLTFFRFLFATILIFAIMIKKEDNWKIEKKDLPIFMALGVIGMVGYHTFFFSALKYTTATNSSLINATNPIITTILAIIFLKDKVKTRNIVSILTSFFGVILIITNGDFGILLNFKLNYGDLLMIIATICWASYSIISKKASENYSPIKITSYAFLVCVVILIPFVLMEKPWVYIPNTTTIGWISVIYMSIFASVGGYLIQQVSIKKIGPSKTSLYINLVPVFSMILAFLILKENISIIKIIAGLLIATGVFLNSRHDKKINDEEANVEQE